jgi:cobalt-zinc-cadmium efflux system protein
MLHGHDHRGHDHRGGGDHHGPPTHDRAFALGVALNLLFVGVEAVAGILANSLALLADAGHNLGDVLGLLLAWGAAWLARRRPTFRRTYGYGRSSILAAVLNAMILLIAVGGIAVEAVGRFFHPEPVAGGTVMIVAAIGIAVNGLTAFLFAAGHRHDLNIRGAFLHMLADAAVSAGVLLAALLIALTGQLWLDPAASLAVAAVIVVGTWQLLKDSVNLALDAVPGHVDRGEVEAYLGGIAGVVEVHDLHIWGLSTTDTALTAHLVRPEGAADDALLAEMSQALRRRFGIGHATFQFETGSATHPCELAPPHVV